MPDASWGIEPAVWFPVVTLLVGGLLTWLSQLLNERRAQRREIEGRRTTRRDASKLRRVEFQRQTLLSLQDKASELNDGTGVYNAGREVRFNATRVWSRAPLEEAEFVSTRVSYAAVETLLERVADDEARDLANTFCQTCVECFMAEDVAKADEASRISAQAFSSLNKRIGALLRSLDDEEDTLNA